MQGSTVQGTGSSEQLIIPGNSVTGEGMCCVCGWGSGGAADDASA